MCYNSLTETRRSGLYGQQTLPNDIQKKIFSHRNFDSKEDVIAKELKKRLDEWWLSAIVKPDFNFVRALFEHYYENSEICILLYRQGLSHLSLQSVLSACGPKDEQENFDAYGAAFFAYGLYGWIEEWFKRGMQETPVEMAELWEKHNNK